MRSEAIVLGAGSSGIFTAIALARRGIAVTLADRGPAGSGTSGSFHGLLHSGARYAVTDPEAAGECWSESRKLIEMAPHCIERTGGLFVALGGSDEAYGSELGKALKRCAIPFSENGAEETRALEPALSSSVGYSLSVDDNVLKGRLFLLSALTTAIQMGVRFMPFMELTGAVREGGSIASLRFSGREGRKGMEIRCRLVINCTGPWTGETSRLLGSAADVMPAAGVMAVCERRLLLRVVNRMRKPSDGDILVPYGAKTIAGTTAALVEDISSFNISGDDLDMLMDEAAMMVPGIRAAGFSRAYASFRPLIRGAGAGGRDATRDFRIEADKDTDNLLTVTGGKMTTSRLVGENAAEKAASILGSARRGEEIRQLANPLVGLKQGSGDPSIGRYLPAWAGRAAGPDAEELLLSAVEYAVHRKESGESGARH